MKSASSIVWPDLPLKPDVVDRWSEPLKFLPVLFVLANIVMVYSIYMVHYGWPTLQDSASSFGKCFPVYMFNFVSVLLVVTYVRCICTPPGTVPSKDSKWQYTGELDSESELPSRSGLVEIKRSGERRYCKWCAKYKPDRCHHCRVCRMCILRMDHHCPWIYNCVGFRNHKFFFLLLFYSVVDCHLVTWSMASTVWAACTPETPFLKMFLLLFLESLVGSFMLMVTCFLGFHMWLMLKAMTTIEFCEKYMKSGGYDTSVYHRGLYGNVKAVLGDNIFLWLLPLNTPAGDGMTFRDHLKLCPADLEASRGGRKLLQQPSYGATRHTVDDTLHVPRDQRLETAGETGGVLVTRRGTPRGIEAGTGAAPDESGGEADASDGAGGARASSTDTYMTSRG